METIAFKRKNVRSTAHQIKMLVDYMSTNTSFANGDFYGPLGVKSHEEEWRKIKALLAEHGPDKTVEQWKQTWKDIKKKARHENAASSLASSQTGNNVPVPIVSDTSKKVLGTIGMECSVGIGPAESPIGGLNQSFAMPELLMPMPVPSLPLMVVEEGEEGSAVVSPMAPSSTASRARRRARPRPAPSVASEFATLQKENNSLLKIIVQLMEEKNSLLREQNNILKRRYPSPTPE